jgi:hypothetical protein
MTKDKKEVDLEIKRRNHKKSNGKWWVRSRSKDPDKNDANSRCDSDVDAATPTPSARQRSCSHHDDNTPLIVLFVIPLSTQQLHVFTGRSESRGGKRDPLGDLQGADQDTHTLDTIHVTVVIYVDLHPLGSPGRSLQAARSAGRLILVRALCRYKYVITGQTYRRQESFSLFLASLITKSFWK